MKQVAESQTLAYVTANENFDTLSHQAVYGKNQENTSGLVWGYYGGRWGGFSVADGTLTLSASSTNYVVAAVATGVVSVSTSNTNWNNNTDYVRVYKLTTGTSTVTAVEDHRAGPGGAHGGAGSSVAPGSVDLATDVAGTLPVANGGSGRVSSTAYAVVCGGTTSTAAQQSVASVGTAGHVLTSNGAGALPTFQAAATGYAPGGADVAVADGGTGVSSLAAYAVLCGGTTSTSAVQPVASVGTAGYVLTSNGAGALPTFQAATGGQPALQFKDEGSNVGTSGGVSSINFVGSGVTASESGGVLTVTISGGGGSSVTTKLSEASYTRPADTTAYAAGDVLAESTSAATVLTFTNIGASNGGGATLLGVTLIDSVAAATPPELELYLFDTAPTMQNDNVAWAPSDAEMEKCLGFVSLYRGLFKTCGANGIVDVDGLSKSIICASGTTSIYGILVHRLSYTPTSAEKFTVRLRYAQG
jgi:hypothetical protein